MHRRCTSRQDHPSSAAPAQSCCNILGTLILEQCHNPGSPKFRGLNSEGCGTQTAEEDGRVPEVLGMLPTLIRPRRPCVGSTIFPPCSKTLPFSTASLAGTGLDLVHGCRFDHTIRPSRLLYWIVLCNTFAARSVQSVNDAVRRGNRGNRWSGRYRAAHGCPGLGVLEAGDKSFEWSVAW